MATTNSAPAELGGMCRIRPMRLSLTAITGELVPFSSRNDWRRLCRPDRIEVKRASEAAAYFPLVDLSALNTAAESSNGLPPSLWSNMLALHI
eukprot:SAG31_NODE_194_length_20722_cov_19.854192_25_plen_93_part_00